LWCLDANRTTWIVCRKCEEVVCEVCIEEFDTAEGLTLLCKLCVRDGALELCDLCGKLSLQLRSVGGEDTPTERDAAMEPGNPGSVPEPVQWLCVRCRESELR
jgi:hypothetical protein